MTELFKNSNFFKSSWGRFLIAREQNQGLSSAWVEREEGIDHLDKSIEDVECSQRISHKEFLKGWKRHKYRKKLAEHTEKEKEQSRNLYWLSLNLQNEYFGVCQNRYQAPQELLSLISLALLDLQTGRILDGEHNGLFHRKGLLRRNIRLFLRTRSLLNNLLSHRQQGLKGRYISLSERDGEGSQNEERSSLRLALFLSFSSTLRFYSC